MPLTLTATRVAAKEHPCTGCHNKIEPGQRYVDIVLPPWAMIYDDVDDEGRPVGSPSGEWSHSRWHSACLDESAWY